MITKELLIILALSLLVAIFQTSAYAGEEDHSGHGHIAASEDSSSESKGESLFSCGMHPQVISKEPGSCPICGMDLTPMKNEGAPVLGKSSSAEIRVASGIIQKMGIRTSVAKRQDLSRVIRTIGEVVVAEDEEEVINLRFSGWVERIWADQTGMKVRKGDPLFAVYSPEILTAQEEYLLAFASYGSKGKQTESSKKRLLLFGLSESQVKNITKKREASRDVIIYSPIDGYVLHKNVVAGARVKAGSDLYRLGDLRKIWVKAEVYESDAPWIKKGAKATMELSFQQGKAREGSISYVYPTINRKSRTLSIRLEFPNPNLELKPGMFATLRIQAEEKRSVMAIASEAVIRSGERKIVFVGKGGGSYEPREVVTGLVGDKHLTEIVSGLNEGETIVVSGQFMLDSESQLQEAIGKFMAGHNHGSALSDTAVSGESADKKGAEAHAGHAHEDGDTNTNTNTKIENSQGVWVCPMHPQIISDKKGSCPICGMDLVKKK